MATIIAGPGAVDGDTGIGSKTKIDVTVTADNTGIITSFEMWFQVNATGVKVGTFFTHPSGTDCTVRDFETVGSVASGSKQTFSGLNCDVVLYDNIGHYAANGADAEATTGGTVYYHSGDGFDGSSHTYSSLERTLSIYGVGTTIIGWAHKIMGIAPGKVMGIAKANIAKIMTK